MFIVIHCIIIFTYFLAVAPMYLVPEVWLVKLLCALAVVMSD